MAAAAREAEMDGQNLLALTISYLYVFGLLFTAEAFHRRSRARGEHTRMAVHIGVGLWFIATLQFFTSWQWGIIWPLTLMVLSYLSYRFQLLEAIETTEHTTLGAVLFPLSFALLLGLLWRPGSEDDRGYIALAGIMAATWGDVMAAIIGRRFGTRRFHFFGQPRTMEGVLAMFLSSSATIAPVLALSGGMDWHRALAFALIAGTVAASVEAVSAYGSDNLSVPLATAGTLHLLIEFS